jgi:hypothetical protein
MQSPKELSLRSAKATDLDALTLIGLAASPLEPQWPTRYPYGTGFLEDHTKFTRLRCREWLQEASTPDCTIVVVESPSLEDANTMKVVDFSIWRIPSKELNAEPNEKRINGSHL